MGYFRGREGSETMCRVHTVFQVEWWGQLKAFALLTHCREKLRRMIVGAIKRAYQ